MRHIWKGVVMDTNDTLIEVLIDLYPEEEQALEDTHITVALRRNSLERWGPPAVVVFEGTDPPPVEVNDRINAVADWQRQVAERQTTLGFEAWVDAQTRE